MTNLHEYLARRALLLFLGVALMAAPAVAQAPTLEGSAWTGGITNTSNDLICRTHGSHPIGDGKGYVLTAEIRNERLSGLLTPTPENNNRHEYKVSAVVAPGRRLERGVIQFGSYIARFEGDIDGDRFKARWSMSATSDIDCTGTVFMTMTK